MPSRRVTSRRSRTLTSRTGWTRRPRSATTASSSRRKAGSTRIRSRTAPPPSGRPGSVAASTVASRAAATRSRGRCNRRLRQVARDFARGARLVDHPFGQVAQLQLMRARAPAEHVERRLHVDLVARREHALRLFDHDARVEGVRELIALLHELRVQLHQPEDGFALLRSVGAFVYLSHGARNVWISSQPRGSTSLPRTTRSSTTSNVGVLSTRKRSSRSGRRSSATVCMENVSWLRRRWSTWARNPSARRQPRSRSEVKKISSGRCGATDDTRTLRELA